jgi:hypothetical protein
MQQPEPGALCSLDSAAITDFEAGRTRLFESVKQPSSILAGLEHIMADGPRLHAMAERSSRHALGFDRIELERNPARDCVLRVHIWWGEPLVPDSGAHDVHNHGRPLAIGLICGSYRHETWDVVPGSSELQHYRYRIDDVTLQTTLQHLGKTAARLNSTVVLAAGECYSLAPRTMHRVFPVEGRVTASLVLQGPLAVTSSDILTTRRLQPSTPRPHVPFDAADLQHKLEQLHEAVIEATRRTGADA